jgi:hypothetical protein
LNSQPHWNGQPDETLTAGTRLAVTETIRVASDSVLDLLGTEAVDANAALLVLPAEHIMGAAPEQNDDVWVHSSVDAVSALSPPPASTTGSGSDMSESYSASSGSD